MSLIPDSHLDLVTGPVVAGQTTIGPDGLPQTAAIWFLYEDGKIRTSIYPGRQRYRNVIANPIASLFVISPTNPFHTIDIRGTVTIEDDPGLAYAEKIFNAYGTTLADFDGPVEGRQILTLHPTKVFVNDPAGD